MSLLTSTVVTAVAAAVLFFGVTRPQHNWDMIGYVASAHYKDGLRGEQLLAKTYAEVKAEVDPERFAALSAGDDYRRGVSQNAAALEEQIPFYSVRVIYVELIRRLGAFGIPYPKATYFLGALFAALSVVVLAIICLRARVSVCFLPLVVLAAGYLQLAQLSTPDSLAVFGSLLAVLACMSGSVWVYVLAAVLPALRTDFVIFSAMLMLAAFYRGQRLASSVALAASLIVYFAVTLSQHAYGWLTLVNFSLVQRMAFPSQIAPSHDVRVYLAMYARAAWLLIGSAQFFIYLVSGYMLVVFRRDVWRREFYTLELLAVPSAFALLHLALYPIYEDRHFVAPASLIVVWILGSLRALSRR